MSWPEPIAFNLVRSAEESVDARFGRRAFDMAERKRFNAAVSAAFRAQDLEAVRAVVQLWTAEVEDRCRGVEAVGEIRRRLGT